MLDLVRLLLALLVLFSHLSGQENCEHFGTYAVFGFYIISGYLITAVSRSTYNLSFRGGGAFLLNRFLRIYPAYYAVTILSLCAVLVFGDRAAQFNSSLQVPRTPAEILSNLLILPLLPTGSIRLIPPSWSLAVELVYYLVLWLLLSRSFRLALAAGVLGSVYTLGLVLVGASWYHRYFDLKPSLLPFAIGACLYFMKERSLLRQVRPWTFLAALVFFTLNLALTMLLPMEQRMAAPFYLNLLIITFLIAGALHVQIENQKLRGFCKYLGKISYPLYLVHWLAGLLVGQCVLHSNTPNWPLLVTTLPVAFGSACLIVHFVDQPMDRLRDRIKILLQRNRPATLTSSPAEP
jgi:peptidoglycan/LPS O-acetylase OafA/YrhL